MDYAAQYRSATEAHGRHKFRKGTKAFAKLGDISRDEEDFFCIDVNEYTTPEDDENYYGHWVTGFGFYNVRFPKETSRELTDEEWEWFLSNPVTLV